MPPILEMTADELIAKGIAPIRKEYILPFIARKAVEAVAGSATAATNGSVVAEKKSKNKIKKERSESRMAELCTNFVLGKCGYGGSCRFSHDTAAYLASKPADLPGSCPFRLQDNCPYGVTCRWAGSHQQAAAAAAASAADNTAAATIPSKATAAAAADKTTAATAGVETVTSEAAAAAAGEHVTQQQHVPHVVELPPIRNVQPTINILSKDLQQSLWKGRYDYSRADAVLDELGCYNNVGGGARGRGNKQRQQQQKGRDCGKGKVRPRSPQQQQQQQGNGVVAAAMATAAAAAAEQEGEPPAKKLHMDEAAAAAAEPAAGAVTVMDELGGLYDTIDASPPAAAAAGSDAAFVSNLTNEQQQQEQQQSTPAAAAAAADTTVDALDGLYETVDAPIPSKEPRSKPQLDIAGKTYLAPLTTVGNLPFRRLCVGLGCEVTCGEMALATNLLQGQASEWALMKRHPSEKYFGVQVCGGYPDTMSKLAQLVDENMSVDFVDINCGCPIDIICNRGAGSALLTRPKFLQQVVRATTACINKPVIVKIRKGYYDDADVAHSLIPQLAGWGAAAVTLHGRSRQQRYSRAADWDYITRCAGIAAESGLPLIGNGDVFSYSEWANRLGSSGVTTAMIGRAALIKPWIFTEIQEQRLWDISASERLDLMKQFVCHGLEHWGSDSRGVEATRRFLLEWLSFTHRYIPVGLLEVTPQIMQWRPPAYRGRNELETLLASESAADWVKISEMLLGPAPAGFVFSPKHKSNAYAVGADAVAQLAGAAAATTTAAAAAADAPGEEEQENG